MLRQHPHMTAREHMAERRRHYSGLHDSATRSRYTFQPDDDATAAALAGTALDTPLAAMVRQRQRDHSGPVVSSRSRERRERYFHRAALIITARLWCHINRPGERIVSVPPPGFYPPPARTAHKACIAARYA